MMPTRHRLVLVDDHSAIRDLFKSIDKHRTRMMEKLHVHDAVAVNRYALQAGLTTLE